MPDRTSADRKVIADRKLSDQPLPEGKRIVGAEEYAALEAKRERSWHVPAAGGGTNTVTLEGEVASLVGHSYCVNKWWFIPGVMSHRDGPEPVMQIAHEAKVRDAEQRGIGYTCAVLSMKHLLDIADFSSIKCRHKDFDMWMDNTLRLNRIEPTSKNKLDLFLTLQKGVDDMFRSLNETELEATKFKSVDAITGGQYRLETQPEDEPPKRNANPA